MFLLIINHVLLVMMKWYIFFAVRMSSIVIHVIVEVVICVLLFIKVIGGVLIFLCSLHSIGSLGFVTLFGW